MKVVIAGGASALGTALKARLASSCDVVTAGRSNCDVELDLTWPLERMSLPDDIDAVVHTAAHFGGEIRATSRTPRCVNVLGTLRLCQAAAGARARRFVLVSSCSAIVSEASEYFGAYALSKRQGEDVARLVCAMHALPLAVLRPTQIYGRGPRALAHQPFLHMAIDRARKGEDIVVYGTRDPLRNYLYDEDLCEIIAGVISRGVVGTYTCHSPVNVTYSQVAKAAFAAFGAEEACASCATSPTYRTTSLRWTRRCTKRSDSAPHVHRGRARRIAASS